MKVYLLMLVSATCLLSSCGGSPSGDHSAGVNIESSNNLIKINEQGISLDVNGAKMDVGGEGVVMQMPQDPTKLSSSSAHQQIEPSFVATNTSVLPLDTNGAIRVNSSANKRQSLPESLRLLSERPEMQAFGGEGVSNSVSIGTRERNIVDYETLSNIDTTYYKHSGNLYVLGDMNGTNLTVDGDLIVAGKLGYTYVTVRGNLITLGEVDISSLKVEGSMISLGKVDVTYLDVLQNYAAYGTSNGTKAHVGGKFKSTAEVDFTYMTVGKGFYFSDINNTSSNETRQKYSGFMSKIDPLLKFNLTRTDEEVIIQYLQSHASQVNSFKKNLEVTKQSGHREEIEQIKGSIRNTKKSFLHSIGRLIQHTDFDIERYDQLVADEMEATENYLRQF